MGINRDYSDYTDTGGGKNRASLEQLEQHWGKHAKPNTKHTGNILENTKTHKNTVGKTIHVNHKERQQEYTVKH